MPMRYDADYVYTPSGLEPAASILVDEQTGRILTVGPQKRVAAQYPHAEAISWRNRLVLPGNVNVHAHAFQHLSRGRGVDQPFLAWRDAALYRITPHLDSDALYRASELAFLEMLHAGITTVAEFFYIHGDGLENDRAVIQAARDVGIRLVLARAFYDWEGAPPAYRETIDEAVRRTQQLASEVAYDPLVTLHIAPHSLHGASDPMIREAVALAEDIGARVHIHVAEEQFEVDEVEARTGHTPVAHLAELGALGPNTIAVHLVCLSAADIELIGESGTNWAYCPSSNLFLADGIAPLPELLGRGVQAGLGTDGGCSNNRANLFDEMRTAALLYKGLTRDATVTGHRQMLNMATAGGAAILGIPAGELAAGALADFISVDLTHPSLAPWMPDTLLANVVYAMEPAAVTDVVVAGQPVVSGRTHRRLDAVRLGQDVQKLISGWNL